MAKIDELFKLMVEKDASDLHLVAGSPPYMRISGEMEKLDMPEVTAQAAQDLIFEICNDKQKKEFITNWELDFAYTNEPIGRFRVNVFMQRKGIGVVCRVIPTKIKTAQELGLPKSLLEMINCHKGLICVTGPTGSGKSTTLAALIHHINANQQSHILTIEDPIEFVHPSLKSLVNQREVHNHSKSFANALKAALREDPDVILVGEMRDLETISLAISAAETGHLVFGTLHTNNAHKTVDRIIDVFPGDRQSQIRVQLSESLRGVISQSLLPKVGGGRVAVQEVMFCNKAIANLIREGKTFQIPSTMQTGKNQGMVTYESAVENLIGRGLLAKDVGMEFLGKATTAAGTDEKPHGSGGSQSAVLGGSAATTPTPPPSGITMQPVQTGPAAALGNLASRFKKSS